MSILLLLHIKSSPHRRPLHSKANSTGIEYAYTNEQQKALVYIKIEVLNYGRTSLSNKAMCF